MSLYKGYFENSFPLKAFPFIWQFRFVLYFLHFLLNIKLRPLVYNKFNLPTINPKSFITIGKLKQELFKKRNHIKKAKFMTGAQLIYDISGCINTAQFLFNYTDMKFLHSSIWEKTIKKSKNGYISYLHIFIHPLMIWFK